MAQHKRARYDTPIPPCAATACDRTCGFCGVNHANGELHNCIRVTVTRTHAQSPWSLYSEKTYYECGNGCVGGDGKPTRLSPNAHHTCIAMAAMRECKDCRTMHNNGEEHVCRSAPTPSASLRSRRLSK